MASYAKQIGDAIVAIVSGVQNAPVAVKLRKDNSLLARETDSLGNGPLAVVSIDSEKKVGRSFEGGILKEYKVIVGLFALCLADISSNLDVMPQLLLRCKQALDLQALTAVSVVWDVDLVDNPEWEHQPFGQGREVSRFGLLVKTSEPKNG